MGLVRPVLFGHHGFIPTMTYRVDPGPVALELGGGITILGIVASGGLGGSF